MEKEEKRYIKLPRTPTTLGDFDIVAWLFWYADSEGRLSENHSRGRVARRVMDAFEKLKPPTDEKDAIKDATENVARLKREIAAAEQALQVLQDGPPPKPIPAYPGDVAEVLDSDWKLIMAWLTDEKDPPKCGFGPAVMRQSADGKPYPAPMPTRLVLDYIDAWRDASTKKPEEPKALAAPEAPAEVEAAE